MRRVPPQSAAACARFCRCRVHGSSASPRTRSSKVSRVRITYSRTPRSEEHTSELQSLMRISYAVFCLKKKNRYQTKKRTHGIDDILKHYLTEPLQEINRNSHRI